MNRSHTACEINPGQTDWYFRYIQPMDAFYAAVEVRDQPELAGQPLIIGHRGPLGVVSTCSYEARRFGVRSAMPSVTAERLCPRAECLPGRMERYVEVSRAVRTIFDEFTPTVEPLSIDEAFST